METVLVTILIPCYNQPHLLQRCLKSINEQIYKNFRIIIIDDCSTISCSTVLDNFKNLSIERFENKYNLGAVPNMIYCMKYPVETPYKIVFHEDDLMHPLLLQKEIEAFQRHPNAAWVGTNMTFFTSKNLFPKYKKSEASPPYFITELKTIVEKIILGAPLSLASVMYNCKYTDALNFDTENYSMLGDRHMLLEHGKRYGCVYIESELVGAYSHDENDYRWKSLRKEHIYNYYLYLKFYFSPKEMRNKQTISGFTRAIVANYALLQNEQKKHILPFIFKLYQKGLISIKYLLLENKIFRKYTHKFLNQ